MMSQNKNKNKPKAAFKLHYQSTDDPRRFTDVSNPATLRRRLVGISIVATVLVDNRRARETQSLKVLLFLSHFAL